MPSQENLTHVLSVVIQHITTVMGVVAECKTFR
jgi:hypothetical protein